MNMICVMLPVKIVSEANQRHHWRVKAQRVAQHRSAASWSLQKHKAPFGSVSVTMTRIAPRELDGDNLQGGFKATRDGVADWLKTDDRDPRISWEYAQRKGRPNEYAAELRIEWEGS